MAVGIGLALLLSVRGDRDVMIDCRGHDEITDLARAFNAMVARIRDETREREAASALLGAARDQALAGARAKADFLAAMSHEIRTPMNGVVGMLGLLSSTPLSPKQQQFVQTAAGSADALQVSPNSPTRAWQGPAIRSTELPRITSLSNSESRSWPFRGGL